MVSISDIFFDGLYFCKLREYLNISFGPSKKTFVPSLNRIWQSQSGYFATNIPQTGHLFLGEGFMGFLSPLHESESVSVSVSKITNPEKRILFRMLFPIPHPNPPNPPLVRDCVT